MAAPTDPPLVDVGAFDRIDGTGAADDFVAWMAHQRRGGADATLEALGLAAGDRVLDLGCGPGADLADLATRVGPTGCAVGIDRAVDAAVAAGAVSAEEGRRYLASLEERDAVGAFVFAALAVTVVARAR